MTPNQYCKDHVAKRGSDIYYSVIFSHPTQRDALIAIYSYYDVIIKIPQKCQDLGIATQKLHWWREEIECLFTEEPSHPIAHALLPTIQKNQLPKQLFSGIIDGTLYMLEHSYFEDNTDFILHCHHTASLREMLLVHVLNNADKELLTFAREAGTLQRSIDIIRELRLDINKGFIWLPQSELKKCNIATEQLVLRNTPKQLDTLLAALSNRSKKSYYDALQKLTAKQRKTLTPLRIHAELKLKLLEQMAADHFQVLKKYYDLPAIRKLIYAWRVKRSQF